MPYSRDWIIKACKINCENPYQLLPTTVSLEGNLLRIFLSFSFSSRSYKSLSRNIGSESDKHSIEIKLITPHCSRAQSIRK